MKLTFPQLFNPALKPVANSVQNQMVFATLLESLHTEVTEVVDEQVLSEELLENLEALLISLQGLSLESSAEDIQYALLHVQELKTKETTINLNPTSQLSADIEKTDLNKLMRLLETIQQKMQPLFDAKAPEWSASVAKEVEEHVQSLDVRNAAQLLGKLDELIGSLKTKQSSRTKPVEEINQLQNVPRLLTEVAKPVKELPKMPIDRLSIRNEMDVVQDKLVPKQLSEEDLRLSGRIPEGKTVQELPAHQVLTVPIEVSKANGHFIRTETSPQPAPFVRVTTLLEDLSGVLKSSMRLAENQEGMKMRVTIFPEHLGHLEILLTSTNGKLAAQIMASTPMAKEALELQLNQLRVSLVQQGVEVEKIEVLEQLPHQSFSQQQSHAEQRFSQLQQKNRTALQDKNGYAATETEPLTVTTPAIGQVMKVDYTV